mgnify:CR=1 FL=1
MGLRSLGIGYIGTSKIETSTGNQEIVANLKPESWTSFRLYSFTFKNYSPCTVIINGGNPIFLDTGEGFITSYIDAPITSFIIVEAGIQYKFVGGL